MERLKITPGGRFRPLATLLAATERETAGRGARARRNRRVPHDRNLPFVDQQ